MPGSHHCWSAGANAAGRRCGTSFDVDEALVDADIYWPRFIRVPWSNIERMARRAQIPIPDL
jgi:hypothetical protein